MILKGKKVIFREKSDAVNEEKLSTNRICNSHKQTHSNMKLMCNRAFQICSFSKNRWQSTRLGS